MLQYLHQYCFLDTQYLSNQAEYKRTWSRSRSSEVVLCHGGGDYLPKTRQLQGLEAIVALQGEYGVNLAFKNARTLAISTITT
jgi:hypothetical protein